MRGRRVGGQGPAQTTSCRTQKESHLCYVMAPPFHLSSLTPTPTPLPHLEYLLTVPHQWGGGGGGWGSGWRGAGGLSFRSLTAGLGLHRLVVPLPCRLTNSNFVFLITVFCCCCGVFGSGGWGSGGAGGVGVTFLSEPTAFMQLVSVQKKQLSTVHSVSALAHRI